MKDTLCFTTAIFFTRMTHCQFPDNTKNLQKPGLLIFRVVAEPRNSGKSAKSLEIHKNTQNTEKFGNLIKYMFVQQFETCLSYWGYLLAVNSQIYVKILSLKRANTRRRLCCEKLGTSHDVKCFAIGSFLEHKNYNCC